jgi:pilus assembly protein CpaF
MTLRDELYGRKSPEQRTAELANEEVPSRPRVTDVDFSFSAGLRWALHKRFHSFLGVFPPEDRPVLEAQLTEKLAALLKAIDTDTELRNLPGFAEDITKIRGMPDLFVEYFRSDILGLGPLDVLMNDPDVGEIMINSPDSIFYEKRGMRTCHASFLSLDHLNQVAARILSQLGSGVASKQRIVEGRWPDGTRLQVVLPPVALHGPSLTIRKGPGTEWGLPELIKRGTLNRSMATFLEACVRAKVNIMISGGTGTGKTVVLGALSRFIPEDERVVLIEDGPQLSVRVPNRVHLQTTKDEGGANAAEVSLRDLLRTSLRMRPDRLIVGECRGGEALDMLQAMNTGHDGCMTTIHANSPRDLVSRLVTLVHTAGLNLSDQAIQKQIALAIQVVVHMERMGDGSRRITRLTAVEGQQDGGIQFTDIFEYISAATGPGGAYRATGLTPWFHSRLERSGVVIPISLYTKDARE